MKLKSIRVENYKKFKEIELTLHPRLNLLIGVNGSGKSTILDAMNIAIGSIFLGIDGLSPKNIKPNEVRHETFNYHNQLSWEQQLPVRIEATGIVNDQLLTWDRTLNKMRSKTTAGGAKSIKNVAEEMVINVRRSKNQVLPLIAYYGTGRLWMQKQSISKNVNKQKPSRLDGYRDAIESKPNVSLMLKWFQKESLRTNISNEPTIGFKLVVNLLRDFYSLFSGFICQSVEYGVDSETICFVYKNKQGEIIKDALDEMSDGYRNTISLMFDIAYRMVVLNPNLDQLVIEKTPGVVLIDEIDLHLHPKWQKNILNYLVKAFPNIQFIATTHAPLVIQYTKKEHIIIIDGETVKKLSEYDVFTYGRNINNILKQIMDMDSRPEDIKNMIESINRSIDKEDINKAREELDMLSEIIGDDDDVVMDLGMYLDLEEIEID